VPGRLRDVKGSEIDEQIARCKKRGTPHALYDAGVLHFRREAYDEAAFCFRHAAEGAPDFAEPEWGRAVLLMLERAVLERAGARKLLSLSLRERFRKAADAFGAFIAIAGRTGQSWWTRKAQEHQADLRARLKQMGRR